jgi:hypothetical protein
MSDTNLDRKLDALFVSYRQACPEVEPGVNFMPELWQKIEAKQSVPLAVRRLSQVFVSMAAALCLLMTAMTFVPAAQTHGTSISYVEALDAEQPMETLAYADIDHRLLRESR